MPQSGPPPPRAFQVLAALGVLAMLGATVYFANAYAGPYRWLAELQMRLWGAHDPRLTFIFTLLLFLVPGAKLARRLRPVVAAAPEQQREQAETYARQAQRWTALQPWLLLAAMGGTLAFVGVRDEFMIEASTQLTAVSCASLEANQVPESSWLDVEGKLLWNATLEAEHNHGQFAYIPLVSAGWTPERPVAVLLRVDRNERHRLDGRSFRGARVADGLPGFVRVWYREAGLDVGRALVLEYGRNPADRATTARVFAIAGPILLMIGLVGGAVKWRALRACLRPST